MSFENLRIIQISIVAQSTREQNMGLSQAQKTLIGIMIIKIATGFTNDWGVISIYILSYFHFRGAPLEIKASTNSLIMIILVIPVTICLIISTKVAHCVGYEKMIRLCSIAYVILPLLSFISFRFEIFLFCNLLLPCSAYALSLVPIFHCMYSHYAHNKSLATGAAICSFGLGAIIWNLVATLAINPDNTVPDIETADPNFNFFPQEIANRVPRAMNLIYLISGAMFLFGAHLITSNSDYKDQHDDSVDLDISPDIVEVASPRKQEKVLETEPENKVTFQQDGKLITAIDPIDKAQQQRIQRQRKKIDLTIYLKNPIVLMLFFLNISACLYQVYVQLNTKIIYMSMLQDDHLISIGLMLIILSSAIFSIAWGFLADRKGATFTIIVFIFLDLAVKIFSCFARTPITFIISMILIGGTDKTMLVLFAPILIDIFGLRVATELLPFKGLSGILSVIVAAALGLVFANFAPQIALYAITSLSVLNLALGAYLARAISHDQIRRNDQKQISN